MFRVEWNETALDELTILWTQANSDQRQALTSATHAIDQRLRNDPRNEGESRSEGRRIAFFPPLTVTYQVEDIPQNVLILHVRMFQKRAK